ncbi:MAG: N-acetylmuramoyl-L-alanine amidase [Acidobacteriota bacterium]|jgi:N-acetylmuramoyl-L-alanine amidase|nr:N-acetylmuramoyl-L-alanine amidase [Acidobacteriota bacterium]MDT7780129.1 N-acetylmuramoyl-L-alanine amidase [Acidobacteriota bacterium]
MKLLTPLVLLLALHLCAPAAQTGKENTRHTSPPAKTAATEAAARTVVCIDPGHPSEVASGKNLQNGTSETHVDWAVAAKLREILESKGYEVVLTKDSEDELVKNKDRALVANRASAALMIRLHCDASTERGFAVYYPDRQGRAKDGTKGPDRAVIDESRRAAESVHAGLAEGLAGVLNDNGVRTDYQTKVGREQGGALTGSIFSAVPVVTIEMVVLSDGADAEFIKTDEGQRRMAESIADGISRFVGPTKTVPPRKDE